MSFPLETQRLILRSFRDDDLDTFVAYRSDPAIARYQSWEAPYSAKWAAAFIAELQETVPGTPGQWYQAALEMKASGAMIGDCAFRVQADNPKEAEIGFTLGRAYQGQGYGTEAVGRLLAYLFDNLDLHRVVAICLVKNLTSARLLERVGMRREAHFVENVWYKGAWASEYWYGILQQEWRDHHRSQ